jgi:alpha-beta hydrolase superfamily lysophospholipase
VGEVNDPEKIARVPADLPIYVFSGSKDPVGDDGKGVIAVCKALEDAGVREVTCRLYEDGRHEMLNETNREEVYSDVIEWLDNHR